MSLDELTAGVRYHYEKQHERHLTWVLSERLTTGFPEVIEEARAAIMKRGFPFPKGPTGTGRI